MADNVTENLPLPHTPVDPLTAHQNRVRRVDDLRDKLVQEEFYAAATDLRSQTCWVKVGNARVLAKAGDDKKGPGEEIQHAELTAIVKIMDEDLYVSCDGYQAPTRYMKNITDYKFSMKLGAPTGYGKADDDFAKVLSNLAELQKDVAVPGARETTSVVNPSSTMPGASFVKVRHVLFVPKGTIEVEIAANEGSDAEEEDAKALSTYTIDNWPSNSAAAQAALDAIKPTHELNPPPFYDMHGKAMGPRQYSNLLRESIVRIRFTLTHYIIGNKTDGLKNVYVADVMEILSLYVAPPRFVSPRKRRIHTLHPDVSPTKKACT